MEIGTILIAIFAYVIIKNHMEQRTKERVRKLQLLEEAIKSGNVDRELIHELAASVSGRRPAPATRPTAEQRPRRTWFLALGWIGIFVGLGMAGLGSLDNREQLVGSGLLVSLISFGVTTYPFALRELEARRRA